MSRSADEHYCAVETGALCARKHWSIYWILIVVALSVASGRVLTIRNPDTRGDSPFFSANDRSRWCTVHALVDYGTYEIDQVIGRKSEIHWDTIDKVQHIGKDGQLHFYSSKPPLLPTLMAGKYWLLQQLTGWRIDRQPMQVVRTLLLIENVLLFGLLLWLLAALLERLFVADWTRYFVIAAAAFGTFLTTFLVTFNNHLPAAVATMLGIYCFDRILNRNAQPGRKPEGEAGWGWYFLAGLACSFAAACDLPALALVGLGGLVCLSRSFSGTALGYVPGFALIAGAFAVTGYLAHGTWEIAYSHRSDGAVVARVTGEHAEALDAGELPEPFIKELKNSDMATLWAEMKLPKLEIGSWMGQPESIEGRWVVRDELGPNQFVVLRPAESLYEIRRWNNWYDYPGSYWSSDNARRSEIDYGETSQLEYAFHSLFGHHGIFSLTPLWIFSAAGLFGLFLTKIYRLRWLGAMGLILSIVVFAFYLTREPHDRNYGGMTSGLRWTFWLIPFWLVALVPVVQSLARTRTGRVICFAVLGLSIISAGYSAANPWVHPWLYQVWDLTGLPK